MKINSNRVELCCHTKMSKLQGFNSAKEYIDEAIKRGYKAIAITDTNSTQAFLEVRELLTSINLKYDAFKAENARKMPDYYTDKGLMLAGFTKEDVHIIKKSPKKYIYSIEY